MSMERWPAAQLGGAVARACRRRCRCSGDLRYDAVTLCATIQGKYDDAERLYERCQGIQETVLGPEHPSLAVTLGALASLYTEQVRGDRPVMVFVGLRVYPAVWCLALFADGMGRFSARRWVLGIEGVVRGTRREIRCSSVGCEPGALAGCTAGRRGGARMLSLL